MCYICSFLTVFWWHCSFRMYTLPQALRVSDHYPVEVELLSATLPSMLKTSLRSNNTDLQQTPVHTTLTGNEQSCNLVCAVMTELMFKSLMRSCFSVVSLRGRGTNTERECLESGCASFKSVYRYKKSTCFKGESLIFSYLLFVIRLGVHSVCWD